MDELNALYGQLLHFGLLTLRQAIYAGKSDWAKLEVQMLHNLPTLIGETNVERHRCYWFVERDIYRERVLALGDSEPASRMRTYYEPVWQEMEPLILALPQPVESSADLGRAALPSIPPAAATSPAR
jgi:hypothetical protein